MFGIHFISCTQHAKSNHQPDTSANKPDTVIVKQKNELRASYEVGFYSKSYTYYWLVGKDTLDFNLTATEYAKDSTLHLSVQHKRPLPFSGVLSKITECMPSVQEDFALSKLSSLYFRDPIFYADLTKELSAEYEKQYGRKNISHKELNEFLLGSHINPQIEQIVLPYFKKVAQYSIEKFHLTDKKDLNHELPNVDLSGYPEFVIHGMGLSVRLESKQ